MSVKKRIVTQEQRDKANNRNDKLRARGICIACGKRKASGEGATGGRCPVCSDIHRTNMRNRYRISKGIPLDKPLYFDRRKETNE